MNALWFLTALYAAARLLQPFPHAVPVTMIVALHVVLPMLFALVHGTAVYGVRNMAAFTAICLGIGFLFEEIGVATGVPFGRYYFTDAMGPKLGYVPVLLGLAYLGMGYVSWVIAHLFLRGRHVPIMAAVIMTTWDLALDPIWSTIEHGWIWQHGGPYFGVPISNYFGWLLTVFVFCWCFQFYLRRFGTRHAPQSPYWKEAIAFYAVAGLGNCLLVFRLRFHAPMADATGAIWSVTSILQACCLVSVLGMGGIAALAWQKAGRLK